MKVDLTLKLDQSDVVNDAHKDNKALIGHVGTHFDVMNKVFPLEYTETEGVVFDISNITGEVKVTDVDLDRVKEKMFVGFYSSHIEKYPYSSKEYHDGYAVLSYELIEELCKRNIAIIGIDFAGIRQGVEHTPADQYCADRGVFVIENMVNLKELVGKKCKVHTYPLNYTGISGLPCRIIADIKE